MMVELASNGETAISIRFVLDIPRRPRRIPLAPPTPRAAHMTKCAEHCPMEVLWGNAMVKDAGLAQRAGRVPKITAESIRSLRLSDEVADPGVRAWLEAVFRMAAWRRVDYRMRVYASFPSLVQYPSEVPARPLRKALASFAVQTLGHGGVVHMWRIHRYDVHDEVLAHVPCDTSGRRHMNGAIIHVSRIPELAAGTYCMDRLQLSVRAKQVCLEKDTFEDVFTRSPAMQLWALHPEYDLMVAHRNEYMIDIVTTVVVRLEH